MSPTSIAKVISLSILAPLAAMIGVGAVSACGGPSSDAPKEPTPGPAAGTDAPPPPATPATPPEQSAEPTSAPAANGAPSDAPAEATPPNAIPTGPKRSLAECTALWDGMQQKVQRFDAAHSACKSDADCATVPARACLGACDTAVAKGAVKEREELQSKISEKECMAFIGGCSGTLPIPVPSCPMYVPVCTGGKCAAKMK